MFISIVCFERLPEIGAMLDPPTAFTTRAELMEADSTLKDKEYFNNMVCSKFTYLLAVNLLYRSVEGHW